MGAGLGTTGIAVPQLLSPAGKELSSLRHRIRPTTAAPSPSLKMGPPPGVPPNHQGWGAGGDLVGWSTQQTS